MGRQPKARQMVIDASRRIVMERGAGALTFDEIVQVSGLTRGGITYHFPTKQHLLRALVEDDIAQWMDIEAQHCPANCTDDLGELIAFIRAHTGKDPEHRRFVAGMLSAATHDPPILDPAREYERKRIAEQDWTDRNLRLQVLRMAALGLFWADVFDCPELPAEARDRLVALLEQLAHLWSTPQSTDQHDE